MVKLLRNRLMLLIIIFLTIFGIYKFWQVNQASAKEKEKSQTTKAEYKNLKQTIILSGSIAADQTAAVRFATAGKLTWVGVKEGDSVKKGQTLATLDFRDIKKNLEKKLNSYMTTRWNFEQTQDSYKVKGRALNDIILTEAERRILEKAQFDLNNSVLDVEIQNLAMEQSMLISPIDGIVTHIDTPYTGVNITPATAEFIIINPQSVYLSVTADQNEVIQLTPGMPANITMDAYPDASSTGIVDTISFTPKTGETNTVYEIKVKLPIDNSDLSYRIDMTADALFVTEKKDHVLSIPSAFIKQDSEKLYVNKYVNGKQIQTFIRTGVEFDTDTEILSGLSEGDIIYD